MLIEKCRPGDSLQKDVLLRYYGQTGATRPNSGQTCGASPVLTMPSSSISPAQIRTLNAGLHVPYRLHRLLSEVNPSLLARRGCSMDEWRPL